MKKEETLDYHVKIVWHAISRMYNQHGAPMGVSASTGFVLLNIDIKNGTPATKIAPKLGMETRSLSRMLTSMEKNGSIIKVPDNEDKRLVRVFLTKQGIAKRDIARKAVIEFNNLIRNSVSKEELETFFSVMTKTNKIIEKYQELQT